MQPRHAQMTTTKGDRLYVRLSASQTRRRLKGLGFGVRKVADWYERDITIPEVRSCWDDLTLGKVFVACPSNVP